MFYIVGLGNPGDKYAHTRHNVGWMAIDSFIEHFHFPKPVSSRVYSGNFSTSILDGEEVTILYPYTYMNKSGIAVKKLVLKGQERSLVVIYDDVDLALGEVKISFGRGAGGHKGVASIIDALGTKDFMRIRIGVAGKSFWTGKAQRPTGDNLSSHVLNTFKRHEQDELVLALQKTTHAVEAIIKDGLDNAMNMYNS